MKIFWNSLFIGVVFIELGAIGLYGNSIFRKKKIEQNVKGVTSVNPIKKEDLIFSTDEEIQYFYEPKPNRVIEEKPNWLPYIATYSINADSLNDRFNYDVEKPLNVFRIITLGDSHTFGHFVNTPENWPELLEDSLNRGITCKNVYKFEVINLGERGYDIASIVKRFSIRGMKYHPDLILWFESGSGFNRILYKMMPLIQQCESTHSASVPIQDPKHIYNCWEYASNIIQKQYGDKQILEYLISKWDEFFKIKKDIPFVYMLYSFVKSDNSNYRKVQLWMENRPNTFIFDNVPNIYELANTRLPDGHPNAKGYKIIANNVLAYVLKNFLTSCEISQSGNLQ